MSNQFLESQIYYVNKLPKLESLWVAFIRISCNHWKITGDYKNDLTNKTVYSMLSNTGDKQVLFCFLV